VPDNHQLRYASAMADCEAALMVEEKDFSGGALPLAVNALLDDTDLRRSLEKNIRAFAGEDPELARYYPEDDRYLVQRSTHVEHHRVLAGGAIPAVPFG
jgi:hypothetical protein